MLLSILPASKALVLLFLILLVCYDHAYLSDYPAERQEYPKQSTDWASSGIGMEGERRGGGVGVRRGKAGGVWRGVEGEECQPQHSDSASHRPPV